MVQLICTDRGQHSPRDMVEMVEMVDWSRWPWEGSTARWHVRWRDAWVYSRRKAFWQPVLPLQPKYPGDLHRDLVEADVLVFRCPTCARRPRWPRHRLDELCDRASAEALPPLDLSLLE